MEARVIARTAELQEAQEALRQAQKLEAMGQLTGGVAHDFNNLLTPIFGTLDLLKRRAIGGEREQRLIDGALESAERARVLVQRLLAFARRQPLQPVAVDLRQGAGLAAVRPQLGADPHRPDRGRAAPAQVVGLEQVDPEQLGGVMLGQLSALFSVNEERRSNRPGRAA